MSTKKNVSKKVAKKKAAPKKGAAKKKPTAKIARRRESHPLAPAVANLTKRIDRLAGLMASAGADGVACTLDTKEEVEAVVIARMQLDWPQIEITPDTKLGDGGLGMDDDAKRDYFYPAMRRATRDGGCQTRLGPNDYAGCDTVQDVIDKIWDDLQKKCNLQ